MPLCQLSSYVLEARDRLGAHSCPGESLPPSDLRYRNHAVIRCQADDHVFEAYPLIEILEKLTDRLIETKQRIDILPAVRPVIVTDIIGRRETKGEQVRIGVAPQILGLDYKPGELRQIPVPPG